MRQWKHDRAPPLQAEQKARHTMANKNNSSKSTNHLKATTKRLATEMMEAIRTGKTTPDESGEPNPPAKPTKAEQTPEQQARAKRAEAKALELAADHLEAKAAKPLVDRAASLRAEADQLQPLKQASKTKAKGDRPVCDQLKKDGTPCTAKAMEGQTFCTDHRPGWMHLKAEEINQLEVWLSTHAEAAVDRSLTHQLVAVFGWGQVRQAIKDGRIK